jgi:hypothetical protein
MENQEIEIILGRIEKNILNWFKWVIGVFGIFSIMLVFYTGAKLSEFEHLQQDVSSLKTEKVDKDSYDVSTKVLNAKIDGVDDLAQRAYNKAYNIEK